jgi:hypothetical protein
MSVNLDSVPCSHSASVILLVGDVLHDKTDHNM